MYIYYKRKLRSRLWFELWNSQWNGHLCKWRQAAVLLWSDICPHLGPRQVGLLAAPWLHCTLTVHLSPGTLLPGILLLASPYPGAQAQFPQETGRGASEQLLLNLGPGYPLQWGAVAWVWAQSRLTFGDPVGYSPPGSLSLGFSRQEYWSVCHFLLQGIFLTQGSNPHLLSILHCRWTLYCWATGESPCTSYPSLKHTKQFPSQRFTHADTPPKLFFPLELSRDTQPHFTQLCALGAPLQKGLPSQYSL